MVLEYGLGTSFSAVSSWIRPNGNFNWTSPVATATAGAVNGNSDGNRPNRSGTLTGLNWANDETLWIRWIELNDDVNDHGLAIDNFRMAAPGVIITESGGTTQVTEGGATDNYTVVLRTPPTNNVVITLNLGTQVTVNQTTLTFTNSNWNVPQTVTVTAVDDVAVEGNHLGTITHTVASGDVAYGGLAVPSVTVSIADNDSAAAVAISSPQSTAQSVVELRPAIAVTDAAGGAIADGTPDFLTFSAIAGETAEQILTIRNGGNGPLRFFDLTLPDGFNLGAALPPGLAPGETARLPLRFTATAPGTVSGVFQLRTNDPAIDLFNFPLLGTVEAAIAPPHDCDALIPPAPDLDFVTPPRSPRLTLKGGDGDDTFKGTDGEDVLSGGGGNDQIFGGLGDDLILGAPTAQASGDLDRDELYGGEGGDRLGGGGGDDLIHSGQGEDFAHGGQGDDELWGDRGDDWLSGDLGNDTLYGGTNDPSLPDLTGHDTLLGGNGNDWLFGHQGDDVLVGGDGNDTLHGGQDDDLLLGGEGDDWLFGDWGNDTLCGGAGADYFALGGDRDGTVTVLDFEAGRDRLVLPTGLSFNALSRTVSDGVLNLSNGSELLAKLANIAPNQLTAADVIASPL